MVPIILGVIAGGAAIAGLGNGVSAVVKNNDAKNINEDAQDIFDEAKKKADKAKNASQKSLEALGTIKLNVLDKSMKKFVDAFSQIKNISFEESEGLNELGKLVIDKQELGEMRELGNMAASMLGGMLGGAGAGALTAFGAYGATMTFAAASTGTAIASLSGVAATNATLAFLGGGSLAAGGLGIAGGTMVLGGLVAGPALAVLGGVMNAKASENLDKAYSNRAKAKAAAEEMNTVTTLCNGISARADMFTALLQRLDTGFSNLVVQLETIVENCGVDYGAYSVENQKTVAMSAALAKAVKTVLDTPILDENGSLTEESKKVYDQISGNRRLLPDAT